MWGGTFGECNGAEGEPGAAGCAPCFPECDLNGMPTLGDREPIVDKPIDNDMVTTKDPTTYSTVVPTTAPSMAPTTASATLSTESPVVAAPTFAPSDDSGCGRTDVVLGWMVLALVTAILH